MAVSGGRFGAAVACLGDVDNDNYGDVAVGAPYSATTEDSGSTGVVFIYYGGLSGLQAGRQPQAIRGSRGVRGLGISLLWLPALYGPPGRESGGRLIMGAAESNTVLSVSRRPVVRLYPGTVTSVTV